MTTSTAHLVAAYAIVAIFVGVYILRTSLRTKKLEAEIAALEQKND